MDFQTLAIVAILVMSFIALIRSLFFPPKKEIIQQERRVRVPQRLEPVDLTNLSTWLQTEIEKRGAYAIDPASLLLMFPANRLHKDDEYESGESLYSIMPIPEDMPATLPEMFPPDEPPFGARWNDTVPQSQYPVYDANRPAESFWDLT